VPIPLIANDYNWYKMGVDITDHYWSYYFTQVKCFQNWSLIFYWLLNTTIINAYNLS
ncbi:hypothetical protein C7212DRAFT_155460, partial [Tuber magnatum]